MHTEISLSRPNENPFESIKRHDAQGNEYWSARELMPLLGYRKWQRFQDLISRAIISCENQKLDPGNHFTHLPGSVSGQGRTGDNYILSRHACHLVAQNGDPRKEQIAAAQGYFSMAAIVLEKVIPKQSEELERLKMVLEIERSRTQQLSFLGSMATMHGANFALAMRGCEDVIVEVDRPTTEVIDQRCGDRRKGMTAPQLNEYLKKKTGYGFKSGAELKRYLQRHAPELVDLIQRPINQEFINEENIEAAMRVLEKRDRQRLIGE